MATQRCPACGTLHDVSIFVSGKRVKCSSCGLPFVVERPESMIGDSPLGPPKQADTPVKPPQKLEKANQAIPKAPPSNGDTAPRNDVLQIPGFEIFEMLGKGGMGRVYRARQISLDRLVAVKILNDDLARHKSFIRRFEKESGALASLNHSNITTIIDRGHVGSTYYFIMEYVAGSSLRQKINSNLAADEIIDLAIELCRAVDHAHQRGVIHRDLKPENVLFTEEGTLKVADFGLANIIGPDNRWELTRTQVSMGTVNYMAPEQRRDAKHVDHRADIYSLGVMIYEMLVGELPLGRFDPPTKRRKDIDERIDRLVLKMLDFEPDRRPQRAGLVAATFESIFSRAKRKSEAKRVEAVDENVDTQPKSKPAGAQEQDSESVDLSSGSLDSSKGPARRARKRISSALAWIIGGVILLALASVGVVTLLVYNNLESQPGDLVVRKTEQDFTTNVVHPRRDMPVSPLQVRKEAEKTITTFDFMPSALPVETVTLIGGSWTAERGKLVQDSCRREFTINQVPARARFGGQPGTHDGATISISLVAQRARFAREDQETVSMEQYLKDTVGGVRVLLPLGVEYRVGAGFLDKQGQGIEILLPLDPNKPGKLIRSGEEMKGGNHEFSVPPKVIAAMANLEMRLTFLEGRIKFFAQDVELINELAGFPLGFAGFPAVACQNVKCSIDKIEYSLP
jgi:serine/threonine protein kinase